MFEAVGDFFFQRSADGWFVSVFLIGGDKQVIVVRIVGCVLYLDFLKNGEKLLKRAFSLEIDSFGLAATVEEVCSNGKCAC